MTKATVPKQVLFFSFWEVKQATLKSNKTDVQNIESTTRVQPEAQVQPSYQVSIGLVDQVKCGLLWYILPEEARPHFTHLFSSLRSLFQSLVFSKAFLEDSHYVTLKIHVNSCCHLWKEKNSSVFILHRLLHLVTPKLMEKISRHLHYAT